LLHVAVAIMLQPEQLGSQPHAEPDQTQKFPPGCPPSEYSTSEGYPRSRHTFAAVVFPDASLTPESPPLQCPPLHAVAPTTTTLVSGGTRTSTLASSTGIGAASMAAAASASGCASLTIAPSRTPPVPTSAAGNDASKSFETTPASGLRTPYVGAQANSPIVPRLPTVAMKRKPGNIRIFTG
jgi:hypothetical protein